MPRGRKPAPKSLEEQIALLEAEINQHKEAIKDLTAKLKAAKAAKEKEALAALVSAIADSGKTIEEITVALQKEKPISENE